MTIRISCECGKELHAPDEFAGRLTRCPVCKREVTLSAASTAVQSATAASSAPLPPPIPTAVQSVAPAVPAAASPTSPPKQGKTAWQAVVSLLLGFLGVCLPLLASLPAILPGVLAFGAIKRGGGQIGGKGMAITGLVLGIATTLLCAPLYCFLGYFGYSLLVAGRDAPKHTESSNNLVVAGTESNNNLVVDGDAAQLRIKSRNNLERIGIAMHDYHQAVGTFPTEERRPGGKFRVSWRVRLLPYLREPGVMAYDENEEWDSPKNKRLLATMPIVFLDPRFQSMDDQSKGLTYYRGFVGLGNILGHPIGIGMEGVFKGKSNPLLVVEAGEPIPWTKPEDPTFNENGPFGGRKRESPFLILHPHSTPPLPFFLDSNISSIPTAFNPKTLQSSNNLRRIGSAMHRYHLDVGTFPTEQPQVGGGKFRVSWRVRLLPYLGEAGMMAYDENEEWDSPKNKRLLASMPKVFLDPRFQSKDDQSKGLTYYRGFAGQGNILGSPNGVGIEGVAGGNSNTLLVVEAGEPIPWTKPEDPTFNENGPFGGPKRESPFLILYADGHISSIPTSFDPKTLHMMIDYRNTTAFTAP